MPESSSRAWRSFFVGRQIMVSTGLDRKEYSESTLSATDIFSVMRLYQVELPEIWELLLMVERRIFSHRQGILEKKRKQELKRKNG